MKKGLTRPKQLTGFFDNYKALKTAMAFLIIFVSFSASAQYDSTKLLQDQNSYGFRWKNGKFRYQLTIPTDTVPMAVADSGSLAYKNGSVYKWSGYSWASVGGTAGWSLTGNALTSPGTNFLGTTDAQPLRFRVNNIWAGQLDENTISGNTSYGFHSGENTVNSGGSEGAYNTSIGHYSLWQNTTGSQNTAVGMQSLISNTTGYDNVGVGLNTLQSNISGADNTAAGNFSLYYSTGSSNIALGGHSGLWHTSGDKRLYINSIQKSTIAEDSTQSIIYGAMDSAAASQRLYLNSQVYTPYYVAQSNAADSMVVINPADGKQGYRAIPAVSSTPTWQQTLTAGSTLTGNNTVDGNAYDFTFSDMGETSITQTAPASVSGANGTAGANPLTVTGSAGGATSHNGALASGGNSGDVAITTGNGGAVTGSPTTGVGGNAGEIRLLGGDGGTGTTNGGNGGNVEMQGGNAGFGTAQGAAGYASVKGGNAFPSGNADGGNVYVVSGAKNGSGQDGSIFLGLSPSLVVRGNTVIGSSTDDYTNKLQVTGNTKLTSSATTTTGLDVSSSTISSGALATFTNTGTAAASNTKKVLSIVSSGANATSTQTVTGQSISVTNTGTTSTNVGLSVTASGASTNNALVLLGNVSATTSDFSGKDWIGYNAGSAKSYVGGAGAWSVASGGYFGITNSATSPFGADIFLNRQSAGVFGVGTSSTNALGTLNLATLTASTKINVTTGANKSAGQATLVGGTVTVNTTAVTASSLIYFTVATPGGTQGYLSVGTITAATSFVINSTSGTETSVVNWWLIN